MNLAGLSYFRRWLARCAPPRFRHWGRAIDALMFREALGRFPTGVTVVTAVGSDGEPYGLTVNSFTSVSLSPPLILVCIDRLSNSHDILVEAGHFVVNVLSEDQGDLAVRFATGTPEERFDVASWQPGPGGDPVLRGVVAWFACSLHAIHRAGDHSILLGHVMDLGTREGDALVFHRGRYGAPAT